MTVLAPTLGLGVDPGVYLLDDMRSVASLSRLAIERGFGVFVLAGRRIGDKTSFLAAASDAMGFPDYFGRNWDALDESIRDLAWVPATGYVLLFDRFERFTHADLSAWETVLDVFRSAAEHWQRQGVPFYVLPRGDLAATPKLPTLQLPDLADHARAAPSRRQDP